MSTKDEKFDAFQGLVARHYVPTFVAKLAEHGMVFDTEEDLAHALQLNGKFAAVLSDGVSLDTLVDAVSARLNVKVASDTRTPISLSTVNYAFDEIMKEAGFPVDDTMRAKQASFTSNKVESVDYRDFNTLTQG
tara:strand:- start:738 stop:1139 length:402 start_codon:yes stop_codon:yes gene_type:complete